MTRGLAARSCGTWLLALAAACAGGPTGAVPPGARWAALSAAALAAAWPAEAEARRFGGGRSFGFRGSRGFGRRSFGGRSGYTRGYRSARRPYYGGGFGFFPFLGFGYGLFGLGRLFLMPLILIIILRLMRARR